ncbi:Uncharacterised protein [Comamonas terrigena]|nr:Uncharacterised protein [Comamonas terrigena]
MPCPSTPLAGQAPTDPRHWHAPCASANSPASSLVRAVDRKTEPATRLQGRSTLPADGAYRRYCMYSMYDVYRAHPISPTHRQEAIP